jgi:perosamine synthetase
MKIPLFKIYSDDKDVKRVSDIIHSGMNWAIGPNVEEFEAKLAKYVGVKHAVTFNSGGSALHAIMISLGIASGDEVIVPSFTFIATANAPLYTGARPVFAEVEGETYGLDPEDVERKVTKRTRAIMPIHYGGLGCKIREIKRIAKKHSLILIEDAAESLGALVQGRMVGAFGDVSIFSFCAPKVISTGEGGAAVTNSDDLCKKLKLVRSYGRKEGANYFSSTEDFDYVGLGYNFRMSNILATLGLSQLSKIQKVIKMRRGNAKYLTGKISHIKGIVTPEAPEDYFHVYQMYTIRVVAGVNVRNALKTYLNSKGIAARVYFPPVHMYSFYRTQFARKEGDLPVTEKISGEVLTLPMYPELTKVQMDYIASAIENFFNKI